MSANYIVLQYEQLLWVLLLLLPPMLLSWFFGLNQNRLILWATFRMAVQLLAIGLVLHWVFAIEHWGLVLLYCALMTTIAGVTAARRTECGYSGMWVDSLTSIAAASWLIGGFAILLVVKPTPWYSPQYVIPLIGMILGNTLNGFTIGISRFLENCRDHRLEIEATLAMGGTRWEAGRPWFRHALSSAMVPIINAMMISGLVSLPGLMTGQILSGVSPFEAVKYQVVMMVLILSSTCLGSILVLARSYSRIFDKNHRFNFKP